MDSGAMDPSSSRVSASQLLQAQLQREIGSREALLGCLHAERKAMQQRDNNGLAQSVERKQQIMRELEALVQSRQSMVADLPGLRRNLLPMAANSEDARRICAYCEGLQSVSEQIARSHETSARLHACGQQILRRLLGVLRGLPGEPAH